MGSYEAFRTSTRPDDPTRCTGRPVPGSARTGPGSESPTSAITECRTCCPTIGISVPTGPAAIPLLYRFTTRHRGSPGRRIRPENADRLDPLAQPLERLVDRGLPDGSLEVDEEHVVAE